jgi:hypothetical protein
MKQFKLLSTLLLSGALVACGGGTDSPSKPDLCEDLQFDNCGLGSSSAQSSSSSSEPQGPRNEALPLYEDFEAMNALDFFSPDYKELFTVNPDDPINSFYYSTSGLESGRMVVGDGKFTIGNARFTIGQTLVTEGTHLNPDAPPEDYKINTTTPGDVLVRPTTTTWGELDLRESWKMSFCVVEWEYTNSSSNNQLFQIMLDNNQSGSALSIHGDARIKELNVGNFVPGKRVEINVPGDVLVGGEVIDGVVANFGTATSFIQLRLPSAAVMTVDDLWIGYQSDTSTEPSADDCSAGTRVPGWDVPLPPIMSTAPVLVAGNGQISVDWETADRATSYTVAYNTVNSTAGATLISDITETETVITGLTNNIEYFVFVQGVNDGGSGEFGPSASAIPVAPLVAPTTPTELTLEAGDQQLIATWSSVDGAETYTLAYNLVNDAVTGATLVEDIPADALSETVSHTISGLSNGNNYYVFVKAVNAAGESDFTAAASATPVAPAGGDQDYEWSFDASAYQAISGFFTAAYDPSNTNTVTTSETVHEVDNLLVFLNDGTALRFRGNSNLWNLNGYSWDGANNLVPANGEAAPALRAYIGIPVDSGREVTLSVTYKQTSSSVASGKIVLIVSDNTVLATKDALAGTEVLEYTAPEGHALTHIKIIYSREGAGGGGIDIGPVTKTYTSASGTGSDREWLLDLDSYASFTDEPDFLAAESSGNRAVNQADPAKSVNGLTFFKTDTGASIRFRNGSGIINFNGSSFTSNARTINADVDGKLDQPLRNYVGVFVTPGEAVTVSFTWKQTTGTVDPSKVGLIDDTNTLLQQENAINGADGVISISLPASHTSSEVRFFYSRENNTSNDGSATGGIDLTAISRLYD